jgi:serine protease AprX
LNLRLRIALILGLLVILAGTVTVNAQSTSSKISPDLAANSTSGNVQVIVQYYNPPSSGETGLLGLLGGVLKLVLGTINAVVEIVPYNNLNTIALDSNVKYISLDRTVGARGQAGAANGAEYTTEPINAPAVWQAGYQGTNVGVAVIDSGITPVADLDQNSPSLTLDTQLVSQLLSLPNEVAPYATGRIVYSQNFVSSQSNALDQYGHGTLVAGLIAGNGSASSGSQYFRTFRGAAPNANIINLRALDENGAGTDSSVISAIDEAISLQSTYNIRVINLSVGRAVYESYSLDPLCQAVEKAWKAGIVVVVAAGNDGRDLALNPEGYGTIDSPGNDPYVITVGAMNTNFTPQINDDIIASYSSKGPAFIDHVVKPDIVTPGNVVTSLQFENDPLAVNNPDFYTWYSYYQTKGSENPSQSYFPMSGTSMAAGVASGAIADLLQAAPKLTPDKVKALIMANGDRSYFPASSNVVADGVTYVANYDVFTIGAGYLDIAKTINAALVNSGSVPAGTAMSPIATYNASTGDITAVIDPSALWAQSGPWSASSVYGGNAFLSGADSAAIWGESPLWTNNDPDGATALWVRRHSGVRARRKLKPRFGVNPVPTRPRFHSSFDRSLSARRSRLLGCCWPSSHVRICGSPFSCAAESTLRCNAPAHASLIESLAPRRRQHAAPPRWWRRTVRQIYK